MKNFYKINESDFYNTQDDTAYFKGKREAVLNTIKPICEAFEITDYDYILNEKQERLVIEGTQISCVCNSIGATVRELIAYLFVVYASDKLWAFKAQTIKRLKEYWIEDKTK